MFPRHISLCSPIKQIYNVHSFIYMVQKSYLQFKFYIKSDLPYAFRFLLLLLFLIEIYRELIPEQLFEERERIRDLWLLQPNQFLS